MEETKDLLYRSPGRKRPDVSCRARLARRSAYHCQPNSPDHREPTSSSDASDRKPPARPDYLFAMNRVTTSTLGAGATSPLPELGLVVRSQFAARLGGGPNLFELVSSPGTSAAIVVAALGVETNPNANIGQFLPTAHDLLFFRKSSMAYLPGLCYCVCPCHDSGMRRRCIAFQSAEALLIEEKPLNDEVGRPNREACR